MIASPGPHRRRNLLTGDWVLVSPQRTDRPWQGLVENSPAVAADSYDETCYLCPGNERAGGERNPDYRGPYAFDNDFPALTATSEVPVAGHRLLGAEAETGHCRVLCFSENHSRHLVDMPVGDIAAVLQFVAGECRLMDERPDFAYVQAFENRGAMMGCSNPHPHGQIWATSSIPNEPGKELRSQLAYREAEGRSLLIDYLSLEVSRGERVVASNAHAVALVPFWAAWPFETLLAPMDPAAGFDDLSADVLAGLAGVLKETLTAYDRLFGVPMPYSMGFHPRPSDGRAHPEWQLHAHIYPPLLRSATVRKHMVGFEMLGMPQRDLTPESAAERMRTALRR